ncbi:Hsp70 family protein [Actinomycetospora lemnae]|uniref:Hsp70 family protein n=1 Tax=Actinomycetospora lemnae TaxID=3019891 RepID=A0ABT5T0K7_9PSEU|nr:Hsp70 family protein [Actinomycetospora sp. DW7H6]MDD7968654.1 Hsp70 family protein [Actinomycetospora sp. DW7H6]
MGYGLGVDLGTTFTAAAVDRDGRVEMATLGDRAAAVPSVILIREDGAVLTGDAAERRAATEPDRVAREVKRRFGDPMPLILGGSPYAAGDLMAHQLRDVVRAVSEREGGMPDVVTLTHPANWGPYKRELFDQIPRQAGLRNVQMITEPEAAAAHYATNQRLEDGATVAVYDLGGGTFDATVLRTAGKGFELLGTPEGIEGLGGIDFDEAVFAHVDRVLGGPVSALDPSDPHATSAVIRLRQDCVLAKEALSADTETTIPVMLPSLQTEVRLTRGEFEDMIRPSITATIASLRRALESANVRPEQLTTVLLVGGSSRIPLVAQMVSAELGRPTAVDAHPKHAIVLGAAGMAHTEYRHGGPAPAGATGPQVRRTAAAATTVVGPMTGPSSGTFRRPGTPPPPRRTGPPSGAMPVVGGVPITSVMPGVGSPIPARGPAPAGTPAAGMPAPALQGGDEPEPKRRRRVPMAVGAALLLALLAGGGTYVYRVASAESPAPTDASIIAPPPAAVVPAPVSVAPASPPAPAADAPASGGTQQGGQSQARRTPSAGSGGGSGGSQRRTTTRTTDRYTTPPEPSCCETGSGTGGGTGTDGGGSGSGSSGP